MGNYRLSIIDEVGRVVDAFDVNCDCDTAARRAAETVTDGRPVEVWQGDRWVAWLETAGSTAVN